MLMKKVKMTGKISKVLKKSIPLFLILTLLIMNFPNIVSASVSRAATSYDRYYMIDDNSTQAAAVQAAGNLSGMALPTASWMYCAGWFEYDINIDTTGWYELNISYDPQFTSGNCPYFSTLQPNETDDIGTRHEYIIDGNIYMNSWPVQAQAGLLKAGNVYLTQGMHTFRIQRKVAWSFHALTAFELSPLTNDISRNLRISVDPNTPDGSHWGAHFLRTGEIFNIYLHSGSAASGTFTAEVYDKETDLKAKEYSVDVTSALDEKTTAIPLSVDTEGRYYLKYKINGQYVSDDVSLTPIEFNTIDTTPVPAGSLEELSKTLIAEIDCADVTPDYVKGNTDSKFNSQMRIIHKSFGSYRETCDTGYAAHHNSYEPGYFAYILPAVDSSKTYLVEVDYPDDAYRSFGIEVREANEAMDRTAYPLTTGIETGNEFKNTNSMLTQKMFFFPKNNNQQPRVVILNEIDGARAAASKIRLYEVTNIPVLKSAQDGRSFGQWYEEGVNFIYNFGGHAKTVKDTIEAGENWVKAMCYTGADTLFPSAAVYQQQLMPSWGGYDCIYDTKYHADYVRMLLLYAEKYGMHVMIDLFRYNTEARFNNTSKTNGSKNLQLLAVDKNGNNAPWESSPLMNVMQPDNQAWLEGWVTEITKAYRDSPAFKGVSLRTMGWNNNGLNNFYSLDWGYDSYTAGRFCQDSSLTDPGTPQSRYTLFTNEQNRQTWIDWRVQQIQDLYTRLTNTVRQLDPDVELYSLITHQFDTVDQMKEWGLSDFNIPGFKFINGTFLYGRKGTSTVYTQHRDWLLNQDKLSCLANSRSHLAWGEYIEDGGTTVPDADIGIPVLDPEMSQPWVSMIANPAGRYHLERYALQLAATDAEFLGNGGNTYFLDQPIVREFMAEYRELPRDKFDLLAGHTAVEPIVVRDLSKDGQYLFYAVNTQDKENTITFDFGQQQTITRLSTEDTYTTGVDNKIQITLQPYQLMAFVSQGASIAGITITEGTYSPPVTPDTDPTPPVIPAPVDGYNNKALSAAATALSCNKDKEPWYATDGSTSTKWESSESSATWLALNLGKWYGIDRWVVRHAGAGGEDQSLNTGDFKLQKSYDGLNWTDVDAVTGNLDNVTDRTLSAPFNSRYVRLYITKPNASTDITSRIYEFEVYGDKPVPPPAEYQETVWVEDALPAGAVVGSDGGDGWTWVEADPVPYSGTKAHQSGISSVFQQHYFEGATDVLYMDLGDRLFTYVYLDPQNTPSEIMLQWKDSNGWNHRAYWGADNVTTMGYDDTVSRLYMGSLPQVGQWVRLEVPANWVGLESGVINGMAFGVYGGRATWDKAGKCAGGPINVAEAMNGNGNIALNKKTIVSGAYSGSYTGVKAADVLPGTYWCETGAYDKWLVVDLGANYYIDRWIVKHAESGGQSADFNTRDFVLQKSDDGAFWTDVDNVAGNTESVTNRTVPTFTSRYLRLYITKGSQNSSNDARIYNFEVYGPGYIAGLSNPGSYSDNMIPNVFSANKYVASKNGIGNKINLYVASGATGHARLGIYSDNSGSPGTLLAETEEITLVNGWNSGSIPDLALTSSTTYWLAFIVDNSGNILTYDLNSGGNAHNYYTYTALPGVAPEGLIGGAGSYGINISGAFEPEPAPTPAPIDSLAGLGSPGTYMTAAAANIFTANKYRATQSGTANEINFYVSNGATGHARLGIYSDNAGSPGNLLAQTGEITLVDGWNSGSIQDVAITSGTTYWLAFILDSRDSTLTYNLNSGGNLHRSYTYGVLPQVGPGGYNAGSGSYAINVSGTVIPAPTPTPTPVNNLAGLSSPGANTENAVPNLFVASRFTANGDGYGNRINFYVASGATGHARLGIYSDNAGSPGNLLCQTEEVTLVNGWNSASIPIATITSGTTYWLVFIVDSSGSVFTYDSLPGGNKNAAYQYGALPGTAPGGFNTGSGQYAIYISSTPESLAGLSSPGIYTTSAALNVFTANKFTANQSGTANQISFHVESGVGHARLGIYNDNAGVPGTLLGQTQEITLVDGWNSSSISDMAITSGTTYWLAFVVDSNESVLTYNLNSGGNLHGSYTYSTLPAEGPGGYTGGSGSYAMNISGTVIPAPTPTPTPVNSFAGLSTPGANTENAVPNLFVASRFTANQSGAGNQISFYVASGATGHTRLGIYSDNAGSPGTLLGATEEVTLANGWNSGIIPEVAITSGTTYWLAYLLDSSGNVTSYDSQPGGNKNAAYPYGALPGEASLGYNTGSGQFAIYVSHTPVKLVGSSSPGANTENGVPNLFTASKFIADQTGTGKQINFYIASGATGHARLGIYSDNAGTPGTLLCETGEVTLANGWNSGSIPDIAITSGTTYWLVFILDSSGNVTTYDSQPGGNKNAAYSYGPLPGTANLGFNTGSGYFGISVTN